MAVEITGIKEFRRALKEMGPEWPKELRRVHAQIARRGQALSRGYAEGMGGVQAKAAGTIKGRGNQRQASIYVQGMRGLGNVAFWGAKRHTGWYANPRYSDGPAQHPPWVGNTWDAAVHGEGPYAINEALADHLDDILDQYLKMLDNLSRKAFPGRDN